MSICVHAFGWSCWPNECLRKTRLSKGTAGRIDVILFTPTPQQTPWQGSCTSVYIERIVQYICLYLYILNLFARGWIFVCVCVFVDFHPFDAMHTRPMRGGKCAGGCKLVWTSSLRRASRQADRRSDMAARRSRNSEYFTKPNRRPLWGRVGDVRRGCWMVCGIAIWNARSLWMRSSSERCAMRGVGGLNVSTSLYVYTTVALQYAIYEVETSFCFVFLFLGQFPSKRRLTLDPRIYTPIGTYTLYMRTKNRLRIFFLVSVCVCCWIWTYSLWAAAFADTIAMRWLAYNPGLKCTTHR